MKRVISNITLRGGVVVLCALVLGASHSNDVRIWEEGNYRYIQSNGIPNHSTGSFPNAGNPNTISAQSYNFRIPLHPQKNSDGQDYGHGLFGVALNGVPFDPGTAEYWNHDRSSGWNYEALSGKINLGIDQNHAHVQPTGAYHYHGVPMGFLHSHASSGPILIGYAADGFPIYHSHEVQSSYRIKSGRRPSGPGEYYDGSFVQDYEYVAGAGNLDKCNGREGVTAEYPQGIYQYYLTDEFPFVPRCHVGSADASFQKERPHTGGGERHQVNSQQQPPARGGDLNRPGQPPEEAISACSGKREGSSCQVRTPHGNLSGACRVVPSGETACVPEGHR